MTEYHIPFDSQNWNLMVQLGNELEELKELIRDCDDCSRYLNNPCCFVEERGYHKTSCKNHNVDICPRCHEGWSNDAM